jgi:VanZ family protein
MIRTLWWTIWLCYTSAWTAALVTPQPVHIRDAIMSEAPAEYTSKVLHVCAYLGFTVLSGCLRIGLPYRWFMLLFLSAHAIGTEYLQQFIPERTPALGDIALDHLGIALGFVVSWRLWLARSSHSSSTK